VTRPFFVVPLVALAAIALTGASESPKPRPAPAAHAQGSSTTIGTGPRDGGVLHGKIVRIDYFDRRMQVLAQRKRVVEVYILPSTTIQGKAAGYHTIADLKKGTVVDVMTSVEGGRTNAEIITLE